MNFNFNGINYTGNSKSLPAIDYFPYTYTNLNTGKHAEIRQEIIGLFFIKFYWNLNFNLEIMINIHEPFYCVNIRYNLLSKLKIKCFLFVDVVIIN